MITRALFGLVLLFSTVVSGLHAQDEKPKVTLTTEADFLALHVSGKAPAGTTALQYRFAESGEIAEAAAWTAVSAKVSDDGGFQFDLPLKSSRWSEIQVRALKGADEVAKKLSRSRVDVFEWLKPERIAAMPEAERGVWSAYMKRSIERREAEFDILASECRKLGIAKASPAPGNRAELEKDSDTPIEWYSSAEAVKLAEAVMSYQTPSGGWSKAVNYTQGSRKPGAHWTAQKGDQWHYCGTIDNRTTTEQVKLLAGVYSATKREDVKTALMRGLEYLWEAQFPNGGWPQNYPIESGYHEAITLNDDAMVHVLEVMLLIAEKSPPFAFAEDGLQKRAQAAYDKGIDCLAAAQVRIDGKLAVWCAQHDPLDLGPVHARTKEPPSLSGGESAELVKFLMRKAPISDKTTAMIEPALAWFESHKLTGLRKGKNEAGKTDYIEDASSTEVYWARFYDLKTGNAIFPGSQDGINYPTFREMAAKNKVAYDFMVTKPRDVIGKEVERWKKRMTKEKK